MITQHSRHITPLVPVSPAGTRPTFPWSRRAPLYRSVPGLDRAAPLTRTAGPILVTGSHRSGTTWVGKILASAPGTCYLHEPFKPGWAPAEIWTRFDTWFAHLNTATAGLHERRLARSLELHFNWRRHWIRKPSMSQACCASGCWARWTMHRLLRHRPVMKDPIAIFSAPWLAERFNMRVIMMIRHPAAFVSSIKLKGWWFDFEHWTRQPGLMSLLLPFAREIEMLARRNDDIIEQAILQWRVFHHVIRGYQHAYPDWHFVRHEDLSREPISGFAAMFRAAGLTFTRRCQQKVLRSSASGNLTDANVAGKSTHFTDLNSAANIHNWQNRLSGVEIRRVRDGTADVAQHFYDDDDWRC
jgi:hypothetical protein